MSMVFCRGCGKEIHITAPTCPNCGAPQASTSNAGSISFPLSSSGGKYGFFDWYTNVLKQYAVFTGRASRKEYWMFILLNLIVAFAVGVIGGVLGGSRALSNIYALAVFIPGLAVAIRRLHDTDRSGWWILLPIVNIVFLALPGQQSDNRFGQKPETTV